MKRQVRLHYPSVLWGNHVFGANSLYGTGMLLIFQGSLSEAFALM